ncbi:exopolysaccharide biosynthesis protein [Azohydromonas lata]|jgi:hypothetical protein|uniref:exopolysaccharide biosynthesis protein n=1 Tax=Azohydromonas lata TaxID=45677 RepID=UPI00082B1D7D|nr:exopolysaccharide biosynthesis protein [Azohydromonas lata]
MNFDPETNLSQTLRALPARLNDQCRLGDVLLALGDRAAALILLVFSIPAIVPSPGIPAGAIFGSALAFIGLQMTLGRSHLRLPPGFARLRVGRERLERMVERFAPHLERIEGRLKAKAVSLAAPQAVRGLGLVVLIMAVLIALPIPFGNTLPGLAILALAMGLAQRDGLAIAGGLGIALVAGVVSVALIGGSWHLVSRTLGA